MRVQGWPVLELKTDNDKVSVVVLAGLKPGDSVEVKASEFFVCDFDENVASLVKDEKLAERLGGALKGRAYRAGFGLRLWHKELAGAVSQTAIVPLVVSPEKDAGSHLVGRFVSREGGLESLWMGFLTDEEIEDNNEILKKIKQAKRAIDRAIPGFSESITREAVSFEPRMRATSLVKRRREKALGTVLVTDQFGPEAAADTFRKVVQGVVGEEPVEETRAPKKPKKQRAMAKRACKNSNQKAVTS